VRRTLWLALLISIQFLAGHTQAVFITVVSALALLFITAFLDYRVHKDIRGLLRHIVVRTVILGGAGVMALSLSAAQLLPTTELSNLSVRSGGLPYNEALSFSFHPLLIGRAFLPGYGEHLFSEFVAYLPLSGWLLISLAIWRYSSVNDNRNRARHNLLVFVCFAVLGLFFAFGAANPVYRLLVRTIPGFALFRAPARWLVLFALGSSILVGMGVDTLEYSIKQRQWRWLVTFCLGFVVIGLIALIAPTLNRLLPQSAQYDVRSPSTSTWIGWLIELVLIFAALVLPRRTPKVQAALVSGIVVATLIVASGSLPANQPTASESVNDVRSSIIVLRAAQELDNDVPAGRLLSMSHTRYDPGDLEGLNSVYHDALDSDAFYDLVVAIKEKEILAPNLPLTYQISTVDGYGGGVLPLSSYVDLQKLFIPPNELSLDGRLRENLADVPDIKWLDLMNIKYIITDKVNDLWSDGIYYDLQFGHQDTGEPYQVIADERPHFQGTALSVVYSLSPQLHQDTEVLQIDLESGQKIEHILTDGAPPQRNSSHTGFPLHQAMIEFDSPSAVTRLSLLSSESSIGEIEILSCAIIDQRDNTFYPILISQNEQIQLIHSGDVKIYEYKDVLPRVFLVTDVVAAQDRDIVLENMLQPGFDPNKQVVVESEQLQSQEQVGDFSGDAEIVEYQAASIQVRTTASQDAWLVLSDTNYPGWQAKIDGNPTEIYPANLQYRAVRVPAGSHTISFQFKPRSVSLGILISAVSLILWVVAFILLPRLLKDVSLHQSGSPSPVD
ncbi:MAG: YfhO family protein, partial [Chloroflexota bacterium]